MSDDELLAALDRLLAEPPCAEDDAELLEIETFAQSVRGHKTIRPGKKVGTR